VCNHPPVAVAATFSGPWGSECIPIHLEGSDPDGDALTFAVQNAPLFGKLLETDPPAATATTKELCYRTNNKFFSGSDTFTYIAIDRFGAKSPMALVKLAVIEI
jgi:hypothetical protein